MAKVIMAGVVFEQDKATKNTIRYQERVSEGLDPGVGILYVQKWALDNPAPDKIRVTIETVE